MAVTYNANQDIKTVRRYFSDATVIRKGQILHYKQDATKTDADPKLRLGSNVQAVTASNIKYLAGIVPDSEAGKLGPCFVELLVPQSADVLDVEVDGTTDVAAGDLLEPDSTKGSLIKATAAAGDNLFISFEAQAADSKVVVRVQRV